MSKNSLPPNDIEFVRNLLRQGSVKWPGRAECLRRARKRVKVGHFKNGKAQYKYYWQCATCSKWTPNEKEMEIDHIKEIGSFCGDWNRYISRQFPAQENLQALCMLCHLKKTKVYNSARTKWRRKDER